MQVFRKTDINKYSSKTRVSDLNLNGTALKKTLSVCKFNGLTCKSM